MHFKDWCIKWNLLDNFSKIYDINPNILVKEVKETKMTAKILVHYICEIEYN